MSRGRDARVPGRGIGVEDTLDPSGELIDRLGELGDRLESAVLAPAGHIRHGLPFDAQADARARQVRRRDVLGEAEAIIPTVDRIAGVAGAASRDLDATKLLLTTQQQVITTVENVGVLGGALDIVLDDAR